MQIKNWSEQRIWQSRGWGWGVKCMETRNLQHIFWIMQTITVLLSMANGTSCPAMSSHWTDAPPSRISSKMIWASFGSTPFRAGDGVLWDVVPFTAGLLLLLPLTLRTGELLGPCENKFTNFINLQLSLYLYAVPNCNGHMMTVKIKRKLIKQIQLLSWSSSVLYGIWRKVHYYAYKIPPQ